jgi:hypothetical protein
MTSPLDSSSTTNWQLIEVTEESPDAVSTSRNQSAIVAGAEIDGQETD